MSVRQIIIPGYSEKTMLKKFISTPRVIFIIYIITGSLYLLAMRSPATSFAPIYAPHKGFFAPNFSLQSLDGKTITLSDLIGKPIFLNFWASWCPPCKAELPVFIKTFNLYKSDDITFISINTTYQDHLEDVKKIVADNQINFPVLLDVEGQISRLYQIQALPTSLFIDEQGKITEIIYGGPISEAVLEINLQKIINP